MWRQKIKMNTKQQLYKQCQEFVNNKLQTIEKTIKSNQQALQSETKSSAGDKHETGRAMLQLEMEKAGQQFKVVSEMKQQLDRIDISFVSKNIRLGSIVKTSMATYFIAIGAGQLTVDDDIYFAISSNSPIGKLLLGKQENDKIEFNGKQIKTLTIE